MKKPAVLLVDDDHDTLDLIELLLYSRYQITVALNGFEGMKIAEENPPDLIITDIMMPVFDGIKFFNSLRRTEKTMSIPVIAITSFSAKYNIKSLLNLGFNGVVTKPFDQTTILETVDKAFHAS